MELLVHDGSRSATIEEYVEAARLLTRLRHYRRDLAAALDKLGAPEFEPQWSGFWHGHRQLGDLHDLDTGHARITDQLDAIDGMLDDPMWAHIEQVVRSSAVPFRRNADTRGSTLCVQDADGDWIVKGDGQLVRGTRAELDAADTVWTALADVLPPSNPSEAGRALSPGTA